MAKYQGHLPLYRQEAMEKAPRPHQPPEREGLRTDPEYTGQMSNSQAGKLGYCSWQADAKPREAAPAGPLTI